MSNYAKRRRSLDDLLALLSSLQAHSEEIEGKRELIEFGLGTRFSFHLVSN